MTEPNFVEGEKVAVRNYTSPLHKWKFGYIVARDGDLQYTCYVDGELWRRHISQIRKIGQDTEVSFTTKPRVPDSIIPNPVTITSTTTDVEGDSNPTANADSLPAAEAQEVTSSPSIAERRTRREIRKPQRLNL